MKSSAVGLDIGSHVLKVLHLEGAPPNLRLAGYGRAACPAGLVANGSVTDPRALGGALKGLIEENEIEPRRVILGLKGPGLFVRRFELPAVEEDELAELISWELEQVLPWSLSEANFDYYIQRRGTAGGEPHEVIVTALRRDVLLGYRQALAAAELEPLAVDHSSFSLENTFHLCFEAEPSQTIALIDLGASASSIHILEGKRTLAVRDELIGGQAVVDHVASRCQAEPEQVELFLMGKRPEEVDPGGAEVSLQEAAEGLADRLLKAVNSLGYGPGESPLTDVVLGGGLARVSTVERCVGERLGTHTELLNPFLNVEYDEARWSHELLQEEAPAAAVAVGLALRALKTTA